MTAFLSQELLEKNKQTRKSVLSGVSGLRGSNKYVKRDLSDDFQRFLSVSVLLPMEQEQ